MSVDEWIAENQGSDYWRVFAEESAPNEGQLLLLRERKEWAPKLVALTSAINVWSAPKEEERRLLLLAFAE